MVSLDELHFNNKDFWTGFIMTSFPTALDEETDMTLLVLVGNMKFRFSRLQIYVSI